MYKKEPEIVFDTPIRVEADQDIPLFLIMNEVDNFPVVLRNLEVAISSNTTGVKSLSFNTFEEYEVSHAHSFKSNLYIFYIPHDLLVNGWNYILPKLTVTHTNREITVITDNYIGISHEALRVYKAHEGLPLDENSSTGDIHCHSMHTFSPVEFGAPIVAYQIAAETMGMDFVAVTDHSYDLECSISNYRKREQNEENWKLQQSTLLPHNYPIVVIGEEISGRKEIGGVVHLGAFGHTSFIKGSGDGARFGYNRKNELSLQSAAAKVVEEGGITFAAHPGERTSLLQRILLRRGNWNEGDLDENIISYQAINGNFDTSWIVAKKIWVKALLNGKKIALVGGNDAHGDFNRYRAIGFPFLYNKENFDRYFGLARTILYSKITHKDDIIMCIKNGKSAITTGLFASINRNESSIIGETISDREVIQVVAKSSKEFGRLKNLYLYVGDYTSKKEELYILPNKNPAFEYEYTVDSTIYRGKSYIRLEVSSEIGERKFESKCVTSPVYIK